jgi:hypothetical protein
LTAGFDGSQTKIIEYGGATTIVVIDHSVSLCCSTYPPCRLLQVLQ